tara:strand:- start:343 stop:1236 length:894 start_codon:yes stop_codon:yes gene_type:complete
MQNVNLSRTELLKLFPVWVEDKVKKLDMFSTKVEKEVTKHIVHIIQHTRMDKDVLLPHQFGLYAEQTLTLTPVSFWWKNGAEDTGKLRFLTGTKTEMKKNATKLVREDQLFLKYADFMVLTPYLKNPPLPKNIYKYTQPPDTALKYECEGCPICLEEWSDTTHQKIAMCGHSCCGECIIGVLKSHTPNCPVCRANYITNQTFQPSTDRSNVVEWEVEKQVIMREVIEYADGREMEGYSPSMFYRNIDIKRMLRLLCDVTKFQNDYAKNNTNLHIFKKLFNDTSQIIVSNGVETIYVD